MYRARLMSLSVMLLATVLLTGPSPAWESPVTVIVNASNPVASLSRDEVSRLFLRKMVRWDDGRPVEVVEPGDRRLREVLAREFHGKSLRWIEQLWNELEASGRERRPLLKAKDEAVVAYVAKDPTAIAYLGRDPGDPRVKIVAVRP